VARGVIGVLAQHQQHETEVITAEKTTMQPSKNNPFGIPNVNLVHIPFSVL
jgi:hypothetical protein